jgi:hypothetical protein
MAMNNYDTAGVSVIKIGNTQLQVPSTYEGTYEDLDSESNRNVNTGVLSRNRVRKGVTTLKIGYNILTKEQAHTIINLIDPASFNVYFYSVYVGKFVTKKMYASNKTFTWAMVIPKNKTKYELVCQNLSFELIEY